MMSDYGVGALGGVVLIDPDTGLPYKAEGGGGGGGAVDSVNGQTGEVELTLGDVFTGTEIIEGTQQTLMMVDDLGSPNDVSQLARGGITVMSAAQGWSASLGARSLTLNASAQGQGQGEVRAPESGSSIVTLPSASGTLARIEDLAPGAVDSVNGQTGEVELTLGDVVDSGELVEGTINLVNNAENPTSAIILNGTQGSVTARSLTTGRTVALSNTGLQLVGSSPTDGAVLTLNPASSGTIEIHTPLESGTLALQSDVAAYFSEIPGYDAGETQTLKNVAGVLTWVTDV